LNSGSLRPHRHVDGYQRRHERTRLFRGVGSGTKRLHRSWRTTHEIDDRRGRPVSYYVYLLLCDDGSFYTGYTSRLASRLHRHKTGRGARYTRMRRPKRFVYVERLGTRRAAMMRERQIKALSHNQKHNLARKAKTSSLKPMRPSYRRRIPFRVT